MPNDRNEALNQVERRLKDIDWSGLSANRSYFPSPAAWEDEGLYFLFIDRFSDGSEYDGFSHLNGTAVAGPTTERTTALFDMDQDAWKANRQAWFSAGKTWCGGREHAVNILNTTGIERYPSLAFEMLQMLSRRIRAIEKTLKNTIGTFLPICANCKKIREPDDSWTPIEKYISDHSETEFSHLICPECSKELYPGI